jgi:hypothetical protein
VVASELSEVAKFSIDLTMLPLFSEREEFFVFSVEKDLSIGKEESELLLAFFLAGG